MRRFEGQTALVTAAASGIGLGVALRLAAEGADVTIWDKDDDILSDVAEQAVIDRLEIHAIKLDMLDGAAISAAVEKMIERTGRIDVLINNIGGSLHPALFTGVLKRRDLRLLGGPVGHAALSVGRLRAGFRVLGELCGVRDSLAGVGVCFRPRLLARHGAMVWAQHSKRHSVRGRPSEAC